MRSGKFQNQASETAIALPAVKAAAKLHRDGQLAQAEILYRRVLQVQPNHFDCLHMLGLIASQRGNHTDAVAQIDAALVVNPNAADALNNRAMALKGLRCLGEALESLDRAIALRPDYADAFNNRGVVLKELRQVDSALASFDRAIAINPRYAEAYNNRGNALRDLDRLDEAVADFDRAIAIRSSYANAFNNRGVALKDLGRFEEALASHDQAIALKADHAEAFYNRGTVLAELKRYEDAVESYDRAIALKNHYADAFNGRGAALKKLARLDDALESCDRAIALRPDFAAALNDRGTILTELKRLDEAVESFERAIALKPNHVAAIINRGYALFELERYEEALASYERAIALDTRNHRAWNNMGATLTKLQRFEQAVASYDGAIAIKPDYPEALNNRGYALAELHRNEDAIASYDRAIALKPDYHEAFNNRGIALMALRRLEEGLQSFDRAIAIKPDYAEGYLNRGNALIELKRPDDAIASFDQILALRPAFADALLNRATAKLLSGRLEEGWRDYEARWDTTNFPSKRPSLEAPEWRGEDLAGRRIAVFTEQGLGDNIQFARYARLLVERRAIVTLLAPAKLRRLLRGLDANIKISGSPKGKSFDFQCPLMSLPFHLGTTESTIPNRVPYLDPEGDRIVHWAKVIGDRGFKIGIAWQGRPSRSLDRGRSIPLAEYARLARLPGVRLISLQKHEGLDQLGTLPPGATVETLGPEFDNGPDAFIDCAAAMSHLDLVITSDTSVAHLAGALGRPTWLALKRVPEWRWQLDREDSPWYPTMRLFRQDTDGDWKGVFTRIEQELQRHLALHQTHGRAGADQVLLENGNVRVKRCKHGLMMFPSNDAYIGRSLDLYGEFSAREEDVFGRLLRPGMTVVDAGANIGTHTLYFAKAVASEGRVVAIEPQRFLYNILCGNIALNGHRNVTALNTALGSWPGSIGVPDVDYRSVGNFGGVELGSPPRGDVVAVRTLDSLDLSSCNLIKVDVEGMEQEVLEGAVELLRAQQPFLYVENDRREKSRDLIAWLLARNYRLYWHLPKLFNPKNYFGNTQNVFGETVSVNMLCVPRGKILNTDLREIRSPDDRWRGP